MKMKKLTKLLSLVLCLAMLFSLAACASKDDTTTDTSSDTTDTADTTSDGEKTVRLGLIGPMTGDNANYGTSTRDGAQIAVATPSCWTPRTPRAIPTALFPPMAS